MESGEARVVNKAAKKHWDFYRDNSSHLKKHLHDLRFKNTNVPLTGGGTDSKTMLVKIGLANLHSPSMENLSGRYDSRKDNVMSHTIRDGAPVNKLASAQKQFIFT